MSGRLYVGIILGGVVLVMLIAGLMYVLVRRGDVAPPPEDSHLQIMQPQLPKTPAIILVDERA